jgi:hypothetical protein
MAQALERGEARQIVPQLGTSGTRTMAPAMKESARRALRPRSSRRHPHRVLGSCVVSSKVNATIGFQAQGSLHHLSSRGVEICLANLGEELEIVLDELGSAS